MTTNVRPFSSIAAGAEAEIVVIRANVSRSYTRWRPSSSIRLVYVPFFFSASLTSNRSAKSESASTRTVSSIGSSAWFRIVSSSWNPSPTARWRITDSFASTYTVPVPGTRKNRASKYCRSSTESALSRSPFTVSTQVERKRVSKENRPVGSVSDASMSPRGSLTTKVFPSRILTMPVAHDRLPFVVDPRFAGAGGPGRARWNNTSRVGSPSSDTTPRSAPAIAFTLPVTMPSNRSLEVLITASAFALRCETETASFPIVRNQRSVVVPDPRSIRREPLVRGGRDPGTGGEPFEELLDGFAHGASTGDRADVPMEPVLAGRAIMPKA